MHVPNKQAEKLLKKIVSRASRDSRVLALILFGSEARGDTGRGSDIDVCLVLTPARRSAGMLSSIRLSYLAAFDLDVHLFQQLPLYMRVRIMREGTVLLCKDEDALYDLAFRTAREFGDFEHIYRDYLREVAHAR